MPKKKIPYSKLYKNGRPGIPIIFYHLDNLRFNPPQSSTSHSSQSSEDQLS